MTEPQRFLVGAHARRHFGGPGHLTVADGEAVLTDRRKSWTVVQRGGAVTLEHKRFEMPGTNRWLAITDGTTTAWATMGRSRSRRVCEALVAAGFTVQDA